MDWSDAAYLWIIVMFYQLFILTAPIHYQGFIGEEVI